MNHLEAIVARVSRRSYLGEPIDAISKQLLDDLITIYNTNYGMSSFLLLDGSEVFDSFFSSYGMFKNVKSIIVLKGLKEDIDLKEKTGYYGQRLILKATQLGFGTCWVGGTFKKNHSVLNIKEDEEVYCIITIGKTVPSLTLKEKAMSTLIHRKEKPMEHFYTTDIEYENLPDYFVMGYKAISKAPTALNSQKVTVDYSNNTTSIHVPDNYRFDMVDLGVAKANFEIATGGTFPLGNHVTFTPKKSK